MGGIEQVIHQLCKSGTKFGLENEVLTLSPFHVPRMIEVEGYKVYRAKQNFELASTGFSVSAFIRFSEMVKKVDIVHYHFPWPFMDMMHLALRVKKPAIITYHSDIIRQKALLRLYRPLMNYFLNDVDHIIATSPNYFVTSEILQNFKNKVSVIPIGINKSTYPIPGREIIEKWHLRFRNKFFLFIGVLRYYKGLHILIEAARLSKITIVIVGAGPVEQELKTKAYMMGLHNVHFLGRLSDHDKVALLMQCYGVVFPSNLRSEAFGISLLEGAMFGKPMISSEIGTGTTFINIDGETGIVIPAGEPAALSQAMKELWENPDKVAKMGRAAELRYQSLFTADRMNEAYYNLYRKLSLNK